MVKEITVGITRKPETDEYRVFWKEGNKYVESKAYYTNEPLDAVLTLGSVFRRAKKNGAQISVSDSKYTQKLVDKYGHEGIFTDIPELEVPYDMSDRQAQEFSREDTEARMSPHMRMMREYGVG